MGQILSDLLGSSNDNQNIRRSHQPYNENSRNSYSNASSDPVYIAGQRHTFVEEEKRRVSKIPDVQVKPASREDARNRIEETFQRLLLEEARKKSAEERLRALKAYEAEARKRELLKKERWIKHYCNSHKILLVGEGDFSFSACLAKAFVSANNMVATSLDSIGFLAKNYRNALSNINELTSRGCTVMHEIDATVMASYYWSNGVRFNRIVYNFPLVGFLPQESRESQIRHNQKLVKSFLMNAKQMISEDGEIHITHKSNHFFKEWNLEGLGFLSGLQLIEEVNFSPSDYPGYNNKYGFGGDRNFDCNPSKTYKFALRTQGLQGKGYIDTWSSSWDY